LAIKITTKTARQRDNRNLIDKFLGSTKIRGNQHKDLQGVIEWSRYMGITGPVPG
jgi:hypothetical protein